MGRLLLLDGHSLAYRAFFALPAQNFATATGQPTNAVFGFTSMLINLLRDEQPTHVAVAFDLSRPTVRLEQYPGYKAGRAATPDEFRSQIPLIIEVLDALSIPHASVEGYEADDVIATLATRAAAGGLEVLICSGDRDAMQLVSDEITVLYPLRGVSELARMTPGAVAGRYGVPPERYGDLAALVGESADNLPGVPGVGPKTATRWLTQYGDLSGIVAHAGDIKGKAGESLRTHLEAVLRNRRLNTLERDLAVPLTIEQTRRGAFDREAVHALFDSLEFRVLRERLLDVLGETDGPAGAAGPAGPEIIESVIAGEQVRAWLAGHAPAGERVGVVVRGTWARGSGDAWAMALASGDGHAASIDLEGLDEAADAALREWAADPERGKVFHDAKPPLHQLRARGIRLRGIAGDTRLAAYLVLPDQRTYDLADLAVRYLGRELTPGGGDGQAMLDFGGGAMPASEDMARARAILDLAAVLEEKVAGQGATGLLRDVELPLIGTLARMERTGIAVSAAGLADLERHFGDAVTAAAADAYDAIGHEVNLSSPKQLQVVLFDELGLPRTKRTKTGYTTDAEAISTLFGKTGHPFLAALLRHRDATKLRSTVEGLIKSVGDDGRIHTTYQQAIAATGRLSSADPNLQNIPIRTGEGRRIRGVFVPGTARLPDGQVIEYERLMSADYSQIEMRIMAHLSGDEGLIEAFRRGEDLHRFVGSRVFGVAPGDVTPGMRAKVKAMSYGLAYGLSAFGLSRQLGIPAGEASALMDEYFERFGGVRRYLREVVEQARAQGYTQTMLGRRRYLPDLNSGNRQRREMAERMALNAPIQGSAADIIKVAMLDVEAAIAAAGLRSRMLLQVHDELVFEVAPGEEHELTGLVSTHMGAAAKLDVPLEVNIGSGADWQQAAH